MRFVIALVMIIACGAAFAQEPSSASSEATQAQRTASPAGKEAKERSYAPASPAPTFTAAEARKLYELGVKTGMAQAVVQAAQQEAKPILDKLDAK